ncbi:MAG: carboxymuconolactone decarboxylase family protein [Lentimicrobium sp.]|jgi:AhpD family alkylhydroperoxidase|nr:carboxymuconolactone decarboxylase family protein [Lentimicrobium sp.]MDD2528307.1 carboxymuconolactone decarboxylase family protein [Lentimicrobiaceae bacterium]MDD4597085.1 carboxymuconolactone decarboxylase family protein [Lentimicrobiaceae bacterium]MDY0025086.1 carboxymuconolactone decarboxylase family protein [Lentimicrobium sp.]HAH58151.1 alkylhydroperoxidase [Bacteroidales bacterium]
MKFEIPESLMRTEYKRKFSFSELYLAYVYLPRAIIKLRNNKKSQLVDLHFIERLQLAVTEVNGCAACSYAHTTMALRQGMSNEEISSFLGGSDQHIKPEEAKAIMFAQHFADTRGYPQKDTYEAIIQEYGPQKARIILSAVQMMIAGNMFGIPFSAFLSRRKGKPFKESSLGYELGMLIGGILVLPLAMIHTLLRWIIGLPNTRFGKRAA